MAHERVLFERVMERLTSGPLESQRLLVPMILELPPAAHDTLVSRAAELGRLGFEVESFGRNTINVTAVPALLNAEESSKTLQALAEDLERPGPRRGRGAGAQADRCDDRLPRCREGELSR